MHTDHVYMDINKPNQPFAIACVLDFKTVCKINHPAKSRV